VIRTRVGYAGGTTANPTYYDLGDHSETVQIDYDPAQITYEELLEVFWDSHDPEIPPFSKQYMSFVFYHNDEQKSLALASLHREGTRSGQSIYTLVIPLSEFYSAEGYHQKYYLQQESDLFQELTAIYPDIVQLTGSTAAARINGYIGGYGTKESLLRELDSLGLSPAGKNRLLQFGK
jgi:peptide-methionine (S)-S-oxide reductase